jgi:hypothetical protein
LSVKAPPEVWGSLADRSQNAGQTPRPFGILSRASTLPYSNEKEFFVSMRPEV